MIFDLKKLISLFLLLAGVAGSFALIFSNSGKPAGGPAPLSVATNGSGAPSPVPKNAFVEPVPQNSANVDNSKNPAENTAARASAPGNLTDSFAATIAEQVLANNPDGPQSGAAGNGYAVNLPNDAYVAQVIQATTQNVDLGINEKISDADIRIANDESPDTIQKYFSLVDALFKETVLSERFQNLAKGDASPAVIASAHLIAEQATEKALLLSVPRPLVGIQRKLLVLLKNQGKIFAAAENYGSDPLKSYLLVKNGNDILAANAAEFKKEAQKLSMLPPNSHLSFESNLPFFAKLFGIHEAHAVIPVIITNPNINIHSILTTISNALTSVSATGSLIKTIATFIYNTMVRVLVNRIINQLQNQVVNWISGGGKPKFVTDWKGFLADAGSAAAGNAIGRIIPGACTGFGPLLRISLEPVANAYDSTRCTLQDVVQNVQSFYGDFRNGGWVAYGASAEPQNNIFGALYLSEIAVEDSVQKAQEAAKNEAIASQGFLGVKQCIRSHQEAVQGPTLNGQSLGAGTVCDEYTTITPGSAVGNSLFGSLNWKANQIVSAQRLEELVAAVIDAGINRVIGLGLSGISGALSGNSNKKIYKDLNTVDTSAGSITGSEQVDTSGVPNPGSQSDLQAAQGGLQSAEEGLNAAEALPTTLPPEPTDSSSTVSDTNTLLNADSSSSPQ